MTSEILDWRTGIIKISLQTGLVNSNLTSAVVWIWIAPTQRPSFCQTPVAHAYNPRYSGGRDQEDGNSKPA
jgi:hypothetical protein